MLFSRFFETLIYINPVLQNTFVRIFQYKLSSLFSDYETNACYDNGKAIRIAALPTSVLQFVIELQYTAGSLIKIIGFAT